MLAEDPTSLKSEELGQFQKLWEKVKTANLKTVAISRFNNTYRASYIEEKLIDSIVALEALFPNPESKGTKKCLLASNCANLIAKNIDEKECIKKEIIRAYNLRSKVIHGMPMDDKLKTEIEDVYAKIHIYLRRAIVKMILDML
jgi:hypothetical protein